jgi:hypothetical protein
VALLAPAAARAGAFAAIEVDRQAGVLTDHAARMQTFAAVFAADHLDARYAALGLDDAPPCATALVSGLQLHWDELSPQERHLVAAATDPFYRASVLAGGDSWLDGDPTEARATCFTPQTAWQQAGEYSGPIETEHFALYFNLGGDVTETKVENLAGGSRRPSWWSTRRWASTSRRT